MPERDVKQDSTVRHVLHMYRFVCPECGMGDGELGHLLPVDEVHCVVCLVEEDRHVRLRRWVAEDHPGNGQE